MQNQTTKLLSILHALFVLVMSCNQRVSNENKIALEHLKAHLEKGMPCNNILRQFGKPERIEGSGIEILYYPIEGNTEMMIRCDGKLMYARQIDSTEKTIIELFD